MPVGRYFIAGMLAFGLIAGLVVANVPALREGPLPTIIWPVIVGLLADIALQSLARQGRVLPLTMAERAIGIIGSAIIITGLVAVASN